MASPEQALFRAVIARAIMDAKGASISGKVGLESLAKQQARSWLLSGGRDFEMVCALADISASALRQAYIMGKLDKINLDTARVERPVKPMGDRI